MAVADSMKDAKRRATELLRAGDALAAAELLSRGSDEVADPGLYATRGYAWQLAGKLEAAESDYLAALDLRPEHPGLLNNLGQVRLARADGAGAEQAFCQILALDEEDTEAWKNLGRSLQLQDRPDESAQAYRRALAIRGDDLEALNNLGNLLKAAGRMADAMDVYQRAVQQAPDHAPTLNNLGVAFQEMDRMADAEASYRRALAADQAYQTARANLASLLEKTHRLEEGLELAEGGLKLDPTEPSLALAAARCERRLERPEAAAARLEQLDPERMDERRRQSHAFEMARLYDRLGRTEDAWRALELGNHLALSAWKRMSPGPDTVRAEIGRVGAFFTPEWTAGWRGGPAAGRSPVFLVGFPRSGTTLLDQILDAHPGVEVLAERPALEQTQRVLEERDPYPEALPELDDGRIVELREAYWAAVERDLGHRPEGLLVDKMPLNSTKAGLVHRLFPEARFILALRHPCDVVLSCFMQEFGLGHGLDSRGARRTPAVVNLLDLESTASFYSEVMALWVRYTETLPLTVHRIRYEDLVRDFDREVRTLCEALDLPFSESMRAFAEHARKRGKINTPSYHQVSRPLYTDSSGRWLRYAEHLRPVFGTLAPWVEAFGYESLELEQD